MVTKCINCLHPEQALLQMCHFDDILDPSGIICAFLILCCLTEGNVLICEHQVMEMMWLFLFKCWLGFIGYDIFLVFFYGQVRYIMSCFYKK